MVCLGDSRPIVTCFAALYVRLRSGNIPETNPKPPSTITSCSSAPSPFNCHQVQDLQRLGFPFIGTGPQVFPSAIRDIKTWVQSWGRVSTITRCGMMWLSAHIYILTSVAGSLCQVCITWWLVSSFPASSWLTRALLSTWGQVTQHLPQALRPVRPCRGR